MIKILGIVSKNNTKSEIHKAENLKNELIKLFKEATE